ncbi:MAG: cell division protein FtsA [Lysobacterales bacterium CG02_land_8_20_14_3_00_62_12]|nr:MAG: cell division protein FtsA [Xanthomonadales bacterium CG02_land_8_20_14_3_00_62_12]PJA42211.1 MAG: cell division protein FtsA [Xanthomonadales bacterium CG_4_9_14_3_um_filter_62_6]
MSRHSDKLLIVGLDIGTQTVSAIVGEYEPGQPLEVIGMGTHASNGLKRGVVVDIESTVQSIQRAIEAAELMAGCSISSVYASISGSHIRSLNSEGVVAIRDREVTEGDVERVLDAARAVAIPADQRILHVQPQEYVIDEQEGIRHPVGMIGVRLEARVHVITGALSATQNISKCVTRCGLKVDDLIPAQLASSQAVLTKDERDLGVCMVDIGAGTTDITVFTQGAMRHTASLGIGGDQVSNDIAFAFRTPTPSAEDIKVRYACALAQLARPEETIEVSSVGDRPPRRLSRQMLADVVQKRYEELFEMVQAELRRSGLEELVAAGIVLTGGGAKMEGVVELAEEMFHMPVRVAIPQGVTGLGDLLANPVYATGIGLLLHGSRQSINQGRAVAAGDAVGSAWDKLSIWFKRSF